MKSFGKVFILGDSFSTFEGYIPEGYWTWYFSDKRTGTDVGSVDETWWKQLIKETESELVYNCSFSGTTICNKGKDGEDCTNKSFIGRFEKLVSEGFFEEQFIDTFFIFGGTNDSWLGSPIGELKFENWIKDDLDKSLSAVCYLINRVQTVCKNTRIIFILNTQLKSEIEQGYKNACQYYGIEYLQLEEIDKIHGHPSVLGMKQIKTQIIEKL